MLLPRIVTRYITPPECKSISEGFRQTANDVRSYAKNVQVTGNSIMEGWLGVSKNKFVSKFESTPADLERYASTLDQMANEIASIKVLIEEEEWYEA